MARPPKKPKASDTGAAKAPDKQIEKIKQEKPEKLEHKDHKDWKEKELKQEKAEKLEHKDHKDWKEGKEGKELKQEKAEKLENKDHKDWKEGKEIKEIDKLQKEHTKIEIAEKPQGKEKDGKEIVENPGDIFEQQGNPAAGAGNAQHFINQGDRPDLSGGALSGEKKPAPKKPKG